MASPLDRPIGNAALTVLNRFGTSATLTRIRSTYNTATGGVAETSTAYPVKCMVEGYNKYLRDGSTVLAGDRKLTIAARALPIEPAPVTKTGNDTYRDTITIMGQTFNVVDSEPVFSGEQVAIWTVQGRR